MRKRSLLPPPERPCSLLRHSIFHRYGSCMGYGKKSQCIGAGSSPGLAHGTWRGAGMWQCSLGKQLDPSPRRHGDNPGAECPITLWMMQIKVEQRGSAGADRMSDNPSEILKSSSCSSIRSDPRRSRGSVTGALLGTCGWHDLLPGNSSLLFLGAASPHCFFHILISKKICK